MNPETSKIFTKLFKEKKTELATQKVELSLIEAESIIKDVKDSAKILDKAKQSYKELKKVATTQASIIAKASSKLESLDSKLFAAFKEAKEIEKSMNNAGISSAPLSSRIKEIQTAGNNLSVIRRELNDLNNSFKRI